MTRKKLLMLLGSVCLALMLVVACAGPAPTPTPTPPIEMRLAYQTVAGTSWHKIGCEGLPDRIAKATDGRVKLILTPDIVKPKDELDAVEDRRIEAAWFVALYFTAVQPAIGICAVPGFWDDSEQYDRVTREIGFFKQLSDWTLSEYNARTLTSAFTLPMLMYSNRPLNRVEDFKGFKMRGPAVEQGELMTALGASPTSIAWTELYMALQTEVVDGAITGFDSGYFASFYEVIDYVTDWPPFRMLNARYFIVNEDFWQTLPADIRSAIERELNDMSQEHIEDLKLEYDKVTDLFRAEGVTVTIVDDEAEIAKARLAAIEVGNAWFGRAKEAGWFFPPRLVKYFEDRGYTVP